MSDIESQGNETTFSADASQYQNVPTQEESSPVETAPMNRVGNGQHVSFYGDSNQFNDAIIGYEDVVTLKVPSKKIVTSRNPLKWFKRRRIRKQPSILAGNLNSPEPAEYFELPLENNKQTGYHCNGRSTSEETHQSKMADTRDKDMPNSMVWTTNLLAAMSIFLIIITFPFSLIYCVRIVAEYERAVVLRMGNLISRGRGTKGPGLFFILPCIDRVRKVDLRTITFAIPPQELLTRDSVTVSVDAVVYYRVLNPVASVLNIEDATRSTRLLAQSTIRNVLGTKDLADILMDRDEISATMQSSLDATTDAWGVKVERVEIKNVRLPIQLQRAMAAEAEAARESRAKVIAAIGEKDAAQSLKKAANVIAASPIALQLRYLQTLCSISAEKNSTIVFPVPIDIMRNWYEMNYCSLTRQPAAHTDLVYEESGRRGETLHPSFSGSVEIVQENSIWTEATNVEINSDIV